jgi:hypothetical protein
MLLHDPNAGLGVDAPANLHSGPTMKLTATLLMLTIIWSGVGLMLRDLNEPVWFWIWGLLVAGLFCFGMLLVTRWEDEEA